MSHKRWQIEQTLLLPTNRKSQMAFSLTYLHLAFAHSKDQSQGHAYFDCEYLENGDRWYLCQIFLANLCSFWCRLVECVIFIFILIDLRGHFSRSKHRWKHLSTAVSPRKRIYRSDDVWSGSVMVHFLSWSQLVIILLHCSYEVEWCMLTGSIFVLSLICAFIHASHNEIYD